MAANPTSAVHELAAEGARSPYEGAHMSLADYLALPETKPALEFWNGVVLQKGVAKRDHLRAQEEIAGALRDYRKQHGGRSGMEGHVWFGKQTIFVPDVLFWGPGRWQGDRERLSPPTLAVEIRSPGQPLVTLRRKCREMVREGADECWLVHPQQKWVEVFDSRRDGERHSNGDLTSPNMPGFAMSLDALWAEIDAE